MLTQPGTRTAYVALVIAAASWGSNPVVARLISEGIPPISLSWLRWTIALLCLLPLVWKERRAIALAIQTRWRILGVLALLANVPQSALIYKGLETTTAINVGLFNSTIPILIVTFGALFFRRAASSREWSAILVSLIGVLIILFQGSVERLLSVKLNGGDLLVFCAMVTWAFYTLLLPRRPSELSLFAFVTAVSFIAVTICAPIALLELAWRGPLEMTPRIGVAVAYIALIPTLLGMIAFSYGAEQVGPIRAGIFVHLMPVFASLFAILLLDEQLRLYHGVGYGLVVSGALLAIRKVPAAQASSPVKAW